MGVASHVRLAYVSPSSERGKAGLEIGLAPLKRIVDLHGSKIKIHSGGNFRPAVEIKRNAADGTAG